MDSAVQRRNMVDSQVRPNDVTDRRIARAMLDVPREAFVPPSKRAVAYMDANLAVTGDRDGGARVLLAPRTLAKLIQHLELADDAVVLDVAPATGYSTAVLAHMTRRVVAVESDTAMAAGMKSVLDGMGLANAEVVAGPAGQGLPDRAPFDAILIGGKIADVPAALLNQLKDGGRLVAIVDQRGVGKATEWRRYGMSFDRRPLFDAEAPVLPGFEPKAEFAL